METAFNRLDKIQQYLRIIFLWVFVNSIQSVGALFFLFAIPFMQGKDTAVEIIKAIAGKNNWRKR